MLFILFGTALVLGSWVWPSLVGGRRAWSEEEAVQLQNSVNDLHQLRFEYGELLKNGTPNAPTASQNPLIDGKANSSAKSDLATTAEKIAAAEERNRGLNAKLEQAKSGGQGTAAAMQWVGIGAVLIGILGYFSMRIGGTG